MTRAHPTVPPDRTNRWLWRPLPRPDARLLLLCFPCAGQGPPAFLGWAERLPPEVELLGVRLPGRHSRISERPFDTWADLLPALLHMTRTVIDRPFALFGHSLGAMVAYELARAAAAAHVPVPQRLLLAGCRAPDVPLLLPAIHRLGEEEFTHALPSVAATPAEVLTDQRMMALVRPLLRADLALAETWPPVAPTPVAVAATVLAGRDDPVAPPWSARRWEHFVGPLALHLLDGDHFFVREHADALLHLLAADLVAVLAETG